MITTDIDFPGDLPCPIRDGYDLKHVQPFVRTAMSSGRARQRRRFTSVPSDVSVSWIFYGDAQTARFELWFQQDIKDGTEWFNCTLKTPIGYRPYVCRFTEMYDGPSTLGRELWRVDARLEIWERPLLEPDWNLLPDYLSGSDIFDIAMNRKWPEA